jgi:hypothetical protein
MGRRTDDRSEPAGELAHIDGEQYYRLTGFDRLEPFLISIASDTDLWMYISSSEGLTAGRVNEDGAVFPYETEDKLHFGHHTTGPISLFRVDRQNGDSVIWSPFCDIHGRGYRVERKLYKNVIGNRLIFEECNRDLKLDFRYRWAMCEEFGLVRSSWLMSCASSAVRVAALDGLRNVLPYGAPLALHQSASSLIDAYRRVDVDPGTKMGIFSLTSRIVDRPEAAEELRANIVWSCGLEDATVRFSHDTVAAFRRSALLDEESVLKGEKAGYFLASTFDLEPGKAKKWHMLADSGRSHVHIASLRDQVSKAADIDALIEASLQGASEGLLRIVGGADGIQLTGHPETSAHHFANVLFNTMRGGVFSDGYLLPVADVLDFMRTRNSTVAKTHSAFLTNHTPFISLPELLSDADETGDPDLARLCHEYLPLYFSRRHGDPSRPWNRFNIRTRNSDGSRALRYEGNWRDIFQNWEALCLSFPAYIPSVVAKFVNASTVDGYNPYRISREGIDWEVLDPDDPWSHIGYWGDHQIIYLLRLLEWLDRYSPAKLAQMLERDIFCYAEVPYRLRPYAKILADPHSTIDYDFDLASRIEERVAAAGTDGRLLRQGDGRVYHVNLLEKLLVPALSKLSNMIPGAGIWMNTQRPEWNDANNALAGNGASMVTLYHLHRYVCFLDGLLRDLKSAKVPVSVEVADWCGELDSILKRNRPLLEAPDLSDLERKRFLDAIGKLFSEYRDKVYPDGFSGRREVEVAGIIEFLGIVTEWLEHSIKTNRREDGLYHSYNIVELSQESAAVSVNHLYEMLEGQVAALTSGVIPPAEALKLVTALFKGKMYREDQRSFMLYPERRLPPFMERNLIPENAAEEVPLLRELLESQDISVIQRDASGSLRFNADFSNAADLSAALERLGARPEWSELVADGRAAAMQIFENIFRHRSFTGRSGTMYGYEGLGCIYWHMVSKLLLSVQEVYNRARGSGEPAPVVTRLAEVYYRIRSGLGFEKTPAEYGAFPTDPYSHTPRHSGARQPGMTGQVKEDIITRFGELGVTVRDGRVGFDPSLLRRIEFLNEPSSFRFYDVHGEYRSLDLPAGALAFTFCQVPVVYQICEGAAWISATGIDGEKAPNQGSWLDDRTSHEIFNRTGAVTGIAVGVSKSALLDL